MESEKREDRVVRMLKKIIKKTRQEYWAIILVVLLTLFLRLFRISSYMTFLGDEGRDALVWLRMLHGKFTLIGPQTSIGNMYLGPLYYYLMFPFYIILGTVGPSVGVALFAGATAFLLWVFGKEWFSHRVGLIASFFYAISPVAIILSRSSWNPNVMPFFSLLIIWGIWQFWQKNRFCWLAVEGVLLSFAVQSHYLGILLLPIIVLFWIIKLIFIIKKEKKYLRNFLFFSCIFYFLFFIFTILPLIWFDLRHNFINYQAFYKFFSERQTTVNFRPYKAIPNLWPLWRNLVTRLVIGKNEYFGQWLAVFFGVGFIFYLRSVVSPILRCIGVKTDKKNSLVNDRIDGAISLLIIWLFIGLFGMGLYKQHIYDHYFGFLFPAVFLITGIILERIWDFKIIGKFLAVGTFLILVFFSFKEIPLKYAPGFQMSHTLEIDKKIIIESGGKPLNLGLIAKQNYDAGYRYFLEKWDKKAVEIDPQIAEETITEQLFVVCEEKECNPTTHPQAEIANFGWSKIKKQWDFPWGVKLFKLIHY